jgi:hypothetical protein
MKGGRLIVNNTDAQTKAAGVRRVLQKLKPEYVHEQFVQSAAGEVYRELSLLDVDLRVNHSWHGIAQRFGIDGGRGCLTKLVSAIMQGLQTPDQNRKSRAFVRMALENFLLRAIGDSPQRLTTATAAEALAALDANVFEHQAGLFLGDFLYEVLRGEEGALPPEVKEGLRPVVQQRADTVVAAFSARYRGKPLGAIPQISYRNLFDVIASQQDWFLGELRK